MTSQAKWRAAVVARFPARETLPAPEAFDRAWAHVGASREEVMALLDMLDLEYDIAPGFFRPDDRLDWLLEKVPQGGVWSRATNEVRAGDRELALGNYLAKRCKAHDAPTPHNLTTLGQFARACSGLPAT